MDAEWFRLDLPEHLGGTGAPPSLRWAVAELLLGANPAAFMYMTGPGFGAILDRLGNADQKQLAQLMVDKQWGATMVLTEPDAGSDVGAGRTKAVQQPDGTWHIEGVKRFITSAEHDLTDNIVHLVLARPEGAGAPAPRACRCSSYRSSTSTSRPASSASATASTSPTSSTRWASRSRRPASSPSARSTPPSAGSSATCTTASRRCSRSSSTPG